MSVNKLRQLLPFLLSLERASLYFFFILLFYQGGANSDALLLLLYLVVIAIESALGLVLFVMFVRYWGKDYIRWVRIVKF